MNTIIRWLEGMYKQGRMRDIAVAVGLALVVVIVLALLALMLGIDVAGLFERGIEMLRVNWNSVIRLPWGQL